MKFPPCFRIRVLIRRVLRRTDIVERKRKRKRGWKRGMVSMIIPVGARIEGASSRVCVSYGGAVTVESSSGTLVKCENKTVTEWLHGFSIPLLPSFLPSFTTFSATRRDAGCNGAASCSGWRSRDQRKRGRGRGVLVSQPLSAIPAQ